MSSNIGTLLSIYFVIIIMMFSGDLACLSAVHNQLDSVALTAGYQISMHGAIDESIENFVYQEAKAYIRCLGNQCSHLRLGDSMEFEVYRGYTPFVISSQPITVTVRRTAIIGYYVD